MAFLVFLRGVNVGGQRTFRPAALARELKHLDVVNIGAAGTFVVHRPITEAKLRVELERRLPFAAEIIICRGRGIVGLMSQDFFRGHPKRPDIVRFVGVLSRSPRATPRLPMSLPSGREWMLKVLARDGRFVVGIYRRRLKVIRYLGKLDQIFGLPVTMRNWNTVAAVARVLDRRAPL